MSKEATIIQSFNDVKRQYEYSVKGYDVTESVKILLKRHKEEYDKEKNIFAGIDGYLEAQKECQSQISDLEAKLAEVKNSCDYYMKRSNDLVCKIGEYKNHIRFKGKEITELKQQLEEKENEIERLNLEFETQEDWQEKWQKLYDETCNLNQDKISFALEQLEKVLVLIHNAVNIDNPEYDLVGLYDAVSNQIKQLKEKNNG